MKTWLAPGQEDVWTSDTIHHRIDNQTLLYWVNCCKDYICYCSFVYCHRTFHGSPLTNKLPISLQDSSFVQFFVTLPTPLFLETFQGHGRYSSSQGPCMSAAFAKIACHRPFRCRTCSLPTRIVSVVNPCGTSGRSFVGHNRGAVLATAAVDGHTSIVKLWAPRFLGFPISWQKSSVARTVNWRMDFSFILHNYSSC